MPADRLPEGDAGVMRAPRTVDIDVTARCNARCLYCYHFDAPGGDVADLPASEWLAFFDELGRLGVMSVTLAGGEPFIRADLPDLIDGIVANRMRFSILSNGALLTDEMAQHLGQTGRCDGVQISVDGSCAEVHDAARGAGSFVGALRALDTLRRHDLPALVRVTVHHFNVGDLDATAALLLEELGLPSFTTNAAGYLGSCCVNARELLLSLEERTAAMTALVRLAHEYPGRISAMAGPLADARMWAEMERARAAGLSTLPGRGRLSGCGCPFSKIAVRADGVVVVCNLLPTMELGRINQDDLTAIWLDHPILTAHRRRRSIPLQELDLCGDCEYLPFCTGNCPATAYTLTGRTDVPSPDSCLRRYLESGGRFVEVPPDA